jgi:hypothetical protein
MGVMAAVAQLERTIIRERVADGIAGSKQNGLYKGDVPIPKESSGASLTWWRGRSEGPHSKAVGDWPHHGL